MASLDDSSFERLVERLATGGYRWEYVKPKREDVASPDASASPERLIPPQINGAQQAFLHLHAPSRERADDELEVVVEIEPGRVPTPSSASRSAVRRRERSSASAT